MFTVGALHQADSAALRTAYAAWRNELAPLAKPLLIVSIGGPTKKCIYGVDLATELVTSLLPMSYFKRLQDIPRSTFGTTKILTPHLGHLAWADAFVITADSPSMLSEACSTGKPVYVIGAEYCNWRVSDFHKTMRERGAARPFTGLEDVSSIANPHYLQLFISSSWSYPPLNDSAEVAHCICEAIAEQGWKIG
nr:unnamed protein product [Digitaria exilis]